MSDTLIEQIKFNVIKGRIEAEDEGYDEGLEGQPAVTELIAEALEKSVDTRSIVNDGLNAAMDVVGSKFEQGEYLIPDMLASAECVGAAMDLIAPKMLSDGIENKGTFVMATVKGDLHDIGKNIVSIMIKGAGYNVIDLGTDVATERIIAEVEKTQAAYLGLSALLTTTMREMEAVISELKASGMRDRVKVLIGGAPTSKEFARQIGADVHCNDAFEGIAALKSYA
jgi:5-methyltetrahydrofolate--homocysteine methyltransferase